MIETFTVIVLGYAIILSVAYVRQLEYITKHVDVMGEIDKIKTQLDVEAQISNVHTDTLRLVVETLQKQQSQVTENKE